MRIGQIASSKRNNIRRRDNGIVVAPSRRSVAMMMCHVKRWNVVCVPQNVFRQNHLNQMAKQASKEAGFCLLIEMKYFLAITMRKFSSPNQILNGDAESNRELKTIGCFTDKSGRVRWHAAAANAKPRDIFCCLRSAGRLRRFIFHKMRSLCDQDGQDDELSLSLEL